LFSTINRFVLSLTLITRKRFPPFGWFFFCQNKTVWHGKVLLKLTPVYRLILNGLQLIIEKRITYLYKVFAYNMVSISGI